MKTTKKRIKLVVNRKYWGRCELYNSQTGKYCPIGFLAKKIGLSKKQIADRSTPELVERDFEKVGSKNIVKWPAKLFNKNGHLSQLCLNIIRINDGASGPQREKDLIELFNKANIDLSFRGKK